MVKSSDRKVSLVTPLGSLNLCWTLHNVIKKLAILHELPYEDLTHALVSISEKPPLTFVNLPGAWTVDTPTELK